MREKQQSSAFTRGEQLPADRLQSDSAPPIYGLSKRFLECDLVFLARYGYAKQNASATSMSRCLIASSREGLVSNP